MTGENSDPNQEGLQNGNLNQNVGNNTSNISTFEIAQEDLEEGPLRMDCTSNGIDDSDVLHFIEKYALNEGFYDYYNQTLQNIFEHPNMKTNILWVENSATGMFIPVRKRTNATETIMNQKSSTTAVEDEDKGLENVPLLPKINLDDNNKKEGEDETLLIPPNPPPTQSYTALQPQRNKNEEWTVITMEYQNFNFMKRLFFLFFQGILAGFCFITFYLQISSKNSEALLNSYKPLAQEVRRFYYLVATISLIGSFDYVLTLWNSHTSRNPLLENLSKDVALKLEDYQKTTLFIGIFVLLLHFLCFLVTILISFIDVQISLKFGYVDLPDSQQSWTTFALNDSTFSGNIDQWITSDRVRIATGVLAWIGCCVLLWRDISRYRKVWQNLRRMRRTALAWMSRVRLLEGAGDLEKLNQSEIKEIIGVLEVGLQRAKNSLNVLERDEQNNLANSNAANVRPNAVSNYASNTNLFPSNLSKKSL